MRGGGVPNAFSFIVTATCVTSVVANAGADVPAPAFGPSPRLNSAVADALPHLSPLEPPAPNAAFSLIQVPFAPTADSSWAPIVPQQMMPMPMQQPSLAAATAPTQQQQQWQVLQQQNRAAAAAWVQQQIQQLELQPTSPVVARPVPHFQLAATSALPQQQTAPLQQLSSSPTSAILPQPPGGAMSRPFALAQDAHPARDPASLSAVGASLGQNVDVDFQALNGASNMLHEDMAELQRQLRRDRVMGGAAHPSHELLSAAQAQADALMTGIQRVLDEPAPSSTTPAPDPSPSPPADQAGVACGGDGQPECEDTFLAAQWTTYAIPGAVLALLLVVCYWYNKKPVEEEEAKQIETFEDMHEVWVLNKNWREGKST